MTNLTKNDGFTTIRVLKKYVCFYFELFGIATGKKPKYSLESEKSDCFEIEFDERKIIFFLNEKKQY